MSDGGGGGGGVYFVFRDEGACATLLSVRIYYVTCPAVVASLAAFAQTPAGPQITSIVQRHGVCVADSRPSDAGGRPTYLCQADGGWYFLAGGCECAPGHRPHNDTSRCIGNSQRTPDATGQSFVVVIIVIVDIFRAA